MLPLQPPGVFGAKLDTSEPNGFVGDSYPALGQQVLNVAVAEIESKIQPYCVADNIWRETMAFVYAHPQIIG